MRVFKKLDNIPNISNPIITIGSFDGVHKGHQEILQKVKTYAERNKGESVVITFHPHPRHVLKQDDFKLITTVDEKASLLSSYGVDNIVVVPFDKSFYTQTPQSYIEDFLIKQFNPRCIIIGYDHQFGKGRAGSIEDLKTYSRKGAFDLIEIPKQNVDDITVSSTKIRKALATGEISTANQLLGHAFSITGKVTHGQRIGHSIGFPTANIEIGEPHKLIPPYGVYAVKVKHQDKYYKGMLYIGDRPTLANFHNKTIEVNIFDFDKNIYGELLTIDFIKFLRPDEKFNGLNALKNQLQKDKINTLKVLG